MLRLLKGEERTKALNKCLGDCKHCADTVQGDLYSIFDEYQVEAVQFIEDDGIIIPIAGENLDWMRHAETLEQRGCDTAFCVTDGVNVAFDFNETDVFYRPKVDLFTEKTLVGNRSDPSMLALVYDKPDGWFRCMFPGRVHYLREKWLPLFNLTRDDCIPYVVILTDHR